MISPLLSRSLLLRLESLTDDDVRGGARPGAGRRARAGRRAHARRRRARPPGPAGRRRRPSVADLPRGGRRGRASARAATAIDLATAETAVDQAAVRYDRQGDQHYDVTSAFIKSIRGSDADAALHYLARMIEAGEDPRFIARRLVILASEDIGLADPTALTTAVAAAQAVQLIGMPEARLNLAQATIALAVAPKSNAVITAIERRQRRRPRRQDRAGAAAPARRPLRRREEARPRRRRYTYSHDEPFGIAEQQYAPDVVADAEYYQPTVARAPRPRSRSAGSGSAG